MGVGEIDNWRKIIEVGKIAVGGINNLREIIGVGNNWCWEIK